MRRFPSEFVGTKRCDKLPNADEFPLRNVKLIVKYGTERCKPQMALLRLQVLPKDAPPTNHGSMLKCLAGPSQKGSDNGQAC